MMLRGLTTIALAAGLFAGAAAHAQAPDLNAVPEQMPFNTPYGSPISAERAQELIRAVAAEAKKHNWSMNIAVVDPNGDLIAFERMDGAQLASVTIAQHKARTAARYRRETVLFENGVQKAGLNYLLTLDDVIASRGGIPLVEGGKIVGAIGCSGGTGSQDEASCKAALSLIK